MNASVPHEQLAGLITDRRRVLDVAARIPVLTVVQAAAFCFIYRHLEISARVGRRTFADFRVQCARMRYLHVSTSELRTAAVNRGRQSSESYRHYLECTASADRIGHLEAAYLEQLRA